MMAQMMSQQSMMVTAAFDRMLPRARMDQDLIRSQFMKSYSMQQDFLHKADQSIANFKSGRSEMRDTYARIHDKVKSAYDRQSAKSVGEFMESILQCELAAEDAEAYQGHYLSLCSIMEEMSMQPSKHQFAVAASAVFEYGAWKKQMWKQPAGTGKSRTLLSMIYLFATMMDEKHFTVYFANKEQTESDWRYYEELLLQLKTRDPTLRIIPKNAKTLAKGQTRTVNLIDEADYFLIDLKDFKVGGSDEFIGLTATTFKEGSTTVEKTYIERKLQVKIFDSQIDALIDTAAEPIKITYEEFLDIGRCDWAKLVYCPESHADKHGITSYDDLVEQAEDFRVVFETGSEYRMLKKRTIYVIKDEVKMRGIDYQAESDGIELLICAPFSCDRAYQQAINRVGRGAQGCARYVVADVANFIDPVQESQLRKRLAAAKDIVDKI